MKCSPATLECKIIVDDNHAALVDLREKVLQADHRGVVPISVESQDRDPILRFKSGKRLLKPSLDYTASAGAGALHYTPTKFDVSRTVVVIQRRIHVLLPLLCFDPIDLFHLRTTLEAIE